MYNTQELVKTSYALELIKYISKHFFDAKIANPEVKEAYLTRLNMMLQYDEYIKMLENYSYSRSSLIPQLF